MKGKLSQILTLNSEAVCNWYVLRKVKCSEIEITTQQAWLCMGSSWPSQDRLWSVCVCVCFIVFFKYSIIFAFLLSYLLWFFVSVLRREKREGECEVGGYEDVEDLVGVGVRGQTWLNILYKLVEK